MAADNYVTLLHLTTDAVRAGLNTYRLTAEPSAEASGACVSTIYKEYEFHVSEPASGATVAVNGQALAADGSAHRYICADGSITEFSVTHASLASGYEWQYRDSSTGNAWVPIPLAVVPTANKPQMLLTPQLDWTILRNSEIRVKVISELACDRNNPQTTYSPSFMLTIPGENKITADLPALVEDCRNSALYLAPALELAGAIAYQ